MAVAAAGDEEAAEGRGAGRASVVAAAGGGEAGGGAASGGGAAAHGGAGRRRRGGRRRWRREAPGGGARRLGRGGFPRAWRAGGGEAVPRATWRRLSGGGVELTLSGAGRTRPSARGDLFFFYFFRVSGRGRDPKTEGCIYRHRGS